MTVDLQRWHQVGRARYGELGVTDAELTAWLAARRLTEAPRHLDDAYLACALCLGHPRALDAFEAAVVPAVAKALGGMGVAPAQQDELLQQTRQHLLVAGPSEQARIAQFTGNGALTNFVSTVAARFVLAHARKEKPSEAIDEPGAAALGMAQDFERSFLKNEQAQVFERAFSDALRSLPARDRTLLRLNLVEGVSAEKLCELHAVSRATLTRWISAARDELAARTRRNLGEATAQRADVEPLLTSLQSNFDVSLYRLFREADDGT